VVLLNLVLFWLFSIKSYLGDYLLWLGDIYVLFLNLLPLVNEIELSNSVDILVVNEDFKSYLGPGDLSPKLKSGFLDFPNP